MSRKSIIVPLRLSLQEVTWLDEMIVSNEQTGFENRGEFFRLLLHREWNRRKGLGPPKASAWQSCARVRPRKEKDEPWPSA